MNNVVYQETLVPANESNCGEPVILYTTEENNGHAVFVWDDHVGTQLVKFFRVEGRDRAIRWAVQEAREDVAVKVVVAANTVNANEPL